MIKTRFAPSPTGNVHLGNIRTALFNALLALHHKGFFLLRIEDTDKTRSSTEFADKLQEDLLWLGLAWQEGPGQGGAQAPYFQAQRQTIYAKYYATLIETGHAYPCFCSEQTLAIARKLQLSAGKPPRYNNHCRQLTAAQVAELTAQGVQPALRFRVPAATTIELNDSVRGTQLFNSSEIGDFIIRRADGSAAFFFCNAIDDALMNVTHVLRGEDHLTNTPRQLLILKTLGLPAPQYGHLALIVGADGAPLSKRHGSKSIQELKQLGYLPAALINYLARLGHYCSDNSFMTLAQLAANFNVNALGAAPAHFDEAQLLYWQKQGVQQLDNTALWNWLGAEIQARVPTALQTLFLQTVKTNITFPIDALAWINIFFDALHYDAPTIALLKAAGRTFFETALAVLQQTGADFKVLSQAIGNTLNLKGKALFQPLRLALTGKLDGPEMLHVVELLGKDTLAARLTAAAQL